MVVGGMEIYDTGGKYLLDRGCGIDLISTKTILYMIGL